MAKLRKQDFYCGAGLAWLFRNNEHISPSLIENVNDINGKNTVGIFYKIKTKSNNEAIIYIKFSSTREHTNNLSRCWKFSLSSVEKEKINKQRDKGIPFFIILICVNDDNISGEIALLTEKDYEKIYSRTNILIGLWSSNDTLKVERQKVYQIKITKGTTRESYIPIKRNQVEIPIDQLIEKYYPSYKAINEKSFYDNQNEMLCAEEQNETLLKIEVIENPRKCPLCGSICSFKLEEYKKEDGSDRKINVAICADCGKKYIGINFYNTFIKNNKKTNIIFEENQYIYLLDNNTFGCKKCDSELVSVKIPLDIHYDITKNNDYIEKSTVEELLYCPKCKMVYATNIIKIHLLKKYGKNKILFQHY